MTSTQLRTLSHDALVDHVRTRLTGTPAAPTRASAGVARSGYVGLDGVPDFFATEAVRQLVAS